MAEEKQIPEGMEIAVQDKVFSIAEIEKIGTIIAKSNLFGIRTPEQAIALCLIADAEGQHPAMAALDYDIIQNRPALRAKALLGRFLAAGGKAEWLERTDECVKATFSHPNGGTVTVDWDTDRAKQAGLLSKDNWKNYPRQMRTARVISEGVGVIWPGAAKLYVPEEVQDFEPRNITTEVEVIPPESKPADKKPKAAKGKSPKDKVKEANAAAEQRAAAKEPAKPTEESAGFDEPTGKILTEGQVKKIAGAFEKFDIKLELLERWRHLTSNKWTDSVRKELLALHKLAKAKEVTKQVLEIAVGE